VSKSNESQPALPTQVNTNLKASVEETGTKSELSRLSLICGSKADRADLAAVLNKVNNLAIIIYILNLKMASELVKSITLLMSSDLGLHSYSEARKKWPNITFPDRIQLVSEYLFSQWLLKAMLIEPHNAIDLRTPSTSNVRLNGFEEEEGKIK
jgi:hypothetical protein